MRKLSPALAALVAVSMVSLAQAQEATSESQEATSGNQDAASVEPLPHPADCTFEKAVICEEGSDCKPTDKLGELALPARFLFHFERRIIAATGPDGLPHITRIRALARAEESIVLQGVSGPTSWTIQSSLNDGGTTFVTASDHAVLTAFGHCEIVE